jgi:hypothetical protein
MAGTSSAKTRFTLEVPAMNKEADAGYSPYDAGKFSSTPTPSGS